MNGRHKRAAHINHERWMVSFADFMTLLFALFVVLFAISSVDQQKLSQVAESVEQAFGVMDSKSNSLLEAYPENQQPIPPIVRPASPLPPVQEQEELVEKLQKALKQTKNLAAAVQLRQEARGVVIQLKDTRLFPSGSAELRPEMLNELQRVMRELENPKAQIRIEGHTDNVPIHSGRYRSNWELSAARANSVLQFFLQRTHLKPEQFSVAGYGEYRPIASNATEAGRARNRRVDIVILNPQAIMEEPSQKLASNEPLDQQLNQKLKSRRP